MTCASPLRIAVIDDDSAFLELMHDLLGSGEGYDVYTSPSWVDSYDFVRRVAPDLVILDLMLGREQAGFAVLDMLRDHAATSDVPVILCSAAAPVLDHHANRLRARPGVACVAKPFDVDDLLHTIARMLDHARSIAAPDKP